GGRLRYARGRRLVLVPHPRRQRLRRRDVRVSGGPRRADRAAAKHDLPVGSRAYAQAAANRSPKTVSQPESYPSRAGAASAPSFSQPRCVSSTRVPPATAANVTSTSCAVSALRPGCQVITNRPGGSHARIRPQTERSPLFEVSYTSPPTRSSNPQVTA